MTPSLQQRLDQLAHEIGRLRPDWQHPERFFERRDELCQKLKRFTQAMEDRHDGY